MGATTTLKTEDKTKIHQLGFPGKMLRLLPTGSPVQEPQYVVQGIDYTITEYEGKKCI